MGPAQEMSRVEAMSKFICNLDEICPFFKAYAEAVKISSYGSQQVDGSNLLFNDSDSTSHSTSLDEIEAEDQLKAIHTSLCRQTYNQFKSYAEQQYPNESDKQKYLITTLQQQYYQQYISQMHPNLKANFKASDPAIDNSSSECEPSKTSLTQTSAGLSSELQTVDETETPQVASSPEMQLPANVVQYTPTPVNEGHPSLDPIYRAQVETLAQQLRRRHYGLRRRRRWT